MFLWTIVTSLLFWRQEFIASILSVFGYPLSNLPLLPHFFQVSINLSYKLSHVFKQHPHAKFACTWLISLTTVSSRSIHFALIDKVPFFLCFSNTPLCKYNTLSLCFLPFMGICCLELKLRIIALRVVIGMNWRLSFDTLIAFPLDIYLEFGWPHHGLFSCCCPVIKYPDKSNIKEKGLTSVHSSRLRSIMVEKWQKFALAGNRKKEVMSA